MKKIVLVIFLLLPIGIFLFLRFFGENEFSIPVYYEQGVDSPPAGCDRKYDAPYKVADKLLENIGWNRRPALIVADSTVLIKKSLNRLEEDLVSGVQVIFFTGKDDYVSSFYACDLLLEAPWKVVLIDQERRIRGYYDPQTREELDRLVVELKILLKK